MVERPLPSETPGQPELSVHERAAQLRREALPAYIIEWLKNVTEQNKPENCKLEKSEDTFGTFWHAEFVLDQDKFKQLRKLSFNFRSGSLIDPDGHVSIELFPRGGERIHVYKVSSKQSIPVDKKQDREGAPDKELIFYEPHLSDEDKNGVYGQSEKGVYTAVVEGTSIQVIPLQLLTLWVQLNLKGGQPSKPNLVFAPFKPSHIYKRDREKDPYRKWETMLADEEVMQRVLFSADEAEDFRDAAKKLEEYYRQTDGLLSLLFHTFQQWSEIYDGGKFLPFVKAYVQRKLVEEGYISSKEEEELDFSN